MNKHISNILNIIIILINIIVIHINYKLFIYLSNFKI